MDFLAVDIILRLFLFLLVDMLSSLFVNVLLPFLNSLPLVVIASLHIFVGFCGL